MNRTSIQIDSITIENRQRKDLGNIEELANSIHRYGLIQPIVVDQNNRLIAGERRLRAHQTLKLTHIDVCYKEALSEDELHEMELEENVQRKEMRWTERCLGIAEIHRLKRRRNILEGNSWGQRQTAEMFNMQVGTINYVLAVAAKLTAEMLLPLEKQRYHQFSSINEAYRLGILRDEEEKAQAELARRHREAVNNTVVNEPIAQRIIEEVKRAEASPDALALQRDRYYANPLNPPGSFEQYWTERQAQRTELENTVYLSNRIHLGDSIAFMNSHEGRFDHIITDIPYGIDMEMLNQQNIHGGLTNLDTVEQEHDVKENMDLMAQFFPASFLATKDSSFVVTCCDIMQWQYMYDLATAAGFAVQRWPVIWHKSNGAMNQCAGYNTTKNYEVVMMCRKPGATLIHPVQSSIVLASSERARKETGHPFAKPYELTAYLLDAISIEGQSVLDPFMGRASMVVEFLRQKRNGFGVELKENHFNAALENIKNLVYRPLNANFIFK